MERAHPKMIVTILGLSPIKDPTTIVPKKISPMSLIMSAIVCGFIIHDLFFMVALYLCTIDHANIYDYC